MPTALPTVKKKFSWIWCEQSELKINPRKKKSWSFTLLIKMCVRFFMNLTAKTQSNALFSIHFPEWVKRYSPEKRRFETVIGKWLQRKLGYICPFQVSWRQRPKSIPRCSPITLYSSGIFFKLFFLRCHELNFLYQVLINSDWVCRQSALLQFKRIWRNKN